MSLMFEFCKLYGYLCSVKMNKEILYIYNCTFIRIIHLYVPKLRMKLYSYVKSIILFYLYTDNNAKCVNYFRDLKKKQERDSDELQQKKKDAEAAVSILCDEPTI